MSQENVARLRLSEALDSSTSRRTMDERLALRFPSLAQRALRAVTQFPVGSRLRRTLMARLLTRGYAATSRGDYELSLIGYDPNVEVHMRDSAMISDDLVGVHRGHDGWRYLVGALVEVWDFRWQPEEAVDCGDRILVSLRLETRGRRSGLPMTHRTFDVITWRNGLVVRQQIFGEREEALEAVGRSE